MNITLIAAARPNFMKVAPIIEAIKKQRFDSAQRFGKDFHYRLVHTGQHYDKNMSGSFFEELGIPKPDANLNCGGGTQAEQTGNVMIAFEKELEEHPADLVMVVGDVNSTMACAIVAKKANVALAHVEAGIRSHDLSMPEEINRMATDAITDYFFTTSALANDNLRKLGVAEDRIFFVGNVMIDTLLKNRSRFNQPPVWKALGLKEKEYLVMTLHRPANVDEEEKLKAFMDELIQSTDPLPLIFPVHPRTAKILENLGIDHPRLHKITPLGYLEFNYLVERAKAVVTDSGGITEEASIMNVPCLTLRDNTERPETIELGTNELVGTDPQAIAPAIEKLRSGNWKQSRKIPLWDGHAAERIVEKLLEVGSGE